jgi:hypothetical protein
MTEAASPAPAPASLSKRLLTVRARPADRITVALGVVFVISVIFYLWIAETSGPLSLHDGTADRYNLLATAFLHFRLSVGPEPAILRHFENPLHPDFIGRALPYLHPVNDAGAINDDALYHGHLYFLWGPAPALVLLVPLHLLGVEPTAGVTILIFGTVGLGFALATLRLLLRQIGGHTRIWMCALAGFAVSLCSVVPFLLRTPVVTIDTLAGGYCFSMAGVWLAMSAVAQRRASRGHLIVMSLCFGLAANSRPDLWLTALILVPVYLLLRSSRSRRFLITSLVIPVGLCFVLFMAYNQARFDAPFEIGSRYQVSVNEAPKPLARLSFVLPGIDFYALAPPRFEVLFPFIRLLAPPASPPPGVGGPELTGGLLPYTPIVAFVVALPWLWRRRPALLGRFATPLLVMAGVGMMIPVLPSYEYYVSTERYETDFATLLVLGGLAAWLALSKDLSGAKGRLLRMAGGSLVIWGCVTGIAISFYGSSTELAATDPGTWRALQEIGSPLSTVLAAAVGHPVVGEIQAKNAGIERTEAHAALSTSISYFTLSPAEHANFTIVAPGSGSATLSMDVELGAGARDGVRVEGPGRASANYAPPAGGGVLEAPVSLSRGLNRLTVSPIATPAEKRAITAPVMLISHVSVSGG